ncbi:3'-5' exonuclease [Rhodoferax sp.]|uniref:3'-5' exonuclease n=1 Tax=Rhodoferax sp. TaxID=50421 RepID=UPI0026175912|nr:3'-5' exonuclease [Rhodoferax sp.]MDD5479377.1 3'-5' exonuclease [Rhodoferax sp.]
MATLIPAFNACVARMTSGEKRLAERLEKKLDDDYLLWYDVPVGPANAHPDFVVLHPRRGLLILEVKDWKPSTLVQVNKQTWTILANGTPKTVANPLEQARQYAHQVVDALKRDPPLTQPDGAHMGQLAFPWSYGVVLTNITRKQFEDAELQHAIEPQRVLCKDEMLETAEPEDLQSRLWDMFPYLMRGALSLPQIDRVRWILFPEVRVPTQSALFDDTDPEADLPSLMRVMDLQQEQLARSLGDGHRVIHGVAGSGKTMILGYRAEHLAKASTPSSKPILILCFNEPLGVKLASHMAAKGLGERVHVRHFHKWCHEQIRAFGQTLPAPGAHFFDDLVERVIRGVERHQIPGGQYQAVLIDEGHDFAPEWLKLVVQMVDPASNSLLVLYDDAQAIYKRSSLKFTLKSVGIKAVGRGYSTILKINYRNTRQILQVASLVAADLLAADETGEDEDKIPRLHPISCGRDGEPALIIRLPTLRDEAQAIADQFANAHKQGHAWGDMAVLCADWKTRNLCAQVLHQRGLPLENRVSPGDFDPSSDKIKVMTMHVSKGLEFPLVALPGVGHMPAPGEDEKEAARVFYVAATRATHKLVIGVGGEGAFGSRLGS